MRSANVYKSWEKSEQSQTFTGFPFRRIYSFLSPPTLLQAPTLRLISNLCPSRIQVCPKRHAEGGVNTIMEEQKKRFYDRESWIFRDSEDRISCQLMHIEWLNFRWTPYFGLRPGKLRYSRPTVVQIYLWGHYLANFEQSFVTIYGRTRSMTLLLTFNSAEII